MPETPQQTMETPYGAVHQPKHGVIQFACLALGLFGGPAFGHAIGQGVLALSENAQIAYYIPFVLVLFMGYGIWTARLNAMAFDLVGRGVLKLLFMLLIRRKKPESLQDVMPSEEKMQRMAVQAQKAAWSFFHAAIPIAAVTGFIALFVDSAVGTIATVALVAGGLLLWGAFVGLLGRRGYMPVMDG